MTPQQQLVNELAVKYSEWIEHVGEKAPQLMIHLLASLLIKEKEENEYLKKTSCK